MVELGFGPRSGCREHTHTLYHSVPPEFRQQLDCDAVNPDMRRPGVKVCVVLYYGGREETEVNTEYVHPCRS